MNAGVLQKFAVGCVCSRIPERNHHSHCETLLIRSILGAYAPDYAKLHVLQNLIKCISMEITI